MKNLILALITFGLVAVSYADRDATFRETVRLATASTNSVLAEGQIFVGGTNGVASPVAVSGDATISAAGAVAIASDAVVNADINSAAAIAHTKLAAVEPTYLLVGNASSQAVAVAVSGSVTIDNAGVVTLASDEVTPANLTTALADEVLYLTVTGADLATNGTGTVTIQVKDAAGNDLDEAALVRTWIGTADDFGPDALTDYSVSTGTQLQEVTANAHYLATSDTNGVVVMAVDFNGATAGTVYAWGEIQGKIVESGALSLTAP